ncbi:MAG: MotA/TolQ/ExbB proton channel family protein [Deltaproteobacteria bacterium]
MMPEWFIKGGPVMWPILTCSIVALAIFLERILSLRRHKIIPRDLSDTVDELVSQKKFSEAKTLCKQNKSSFSKIVLTALKHEGKQRNLIKENVEESGKKESLQLGKNIHALATIAHISPLLGLLGTVLGMLHVFSVITEKGVGNAQSLAGGISQALITTVAGLIVAIPTVVAYRYLNARVKTFVTEIEEYSLKIVDELTGAPTAGDS